MKKLLAVLLSCLSIALAQNASADQKQKVVTIGVIYPMTGALASTGQQLKQAVELAVDIVNHPHPGLAGIPLAQGKGLPNLGGAKIKVVFADSQGSPEVGMADAQRLIDQDHAVALVGCYQSSVTKTASRVAEQRGIPFLNPESSDPELTERGFKWFFRITPTDNTYISNMMQFLDGIKKLPTKRIAVVYENTDFGVNTDKAVKKFAKESGRTVVTNIAYSAGSPSLEAETQKLADAKPDVAIFASYTSDAILFVRTMRQMKYAPPIFLTNDAGFIDPHFISQMASQVQGVLTRNTWSTDLFKTKPVIKTINDLFKAKSGNDLSGTAPLAIQGILVLADAINRAGSTDPQAIRKALIAIDLEANQVIMPWKGIKFDAMGQNPEGSGLILQMEGSNYKVVWPTIYRTDPSLPKLPFSWK